MTEFLLDTSSHPGSLVTARAPESPFSSSVGELAGRSLGTDFTALGTRLGGQLEREAPALLRRGRSTLSAAAVVFVLAEHTRLFDYDCCVTRASFAGELGTTLPALRRRLGVVRPILAGHLPPVAAPDASTRSL